MKNIFFIGLFIFSLSVSAQDKSGVVTTTLLVKGNCEDCKKRIENAADIKGVKFFEWNPETKVAKVIYLESKTNLETIEKAIASKGYDTPTQTGDVKAYNKLPGCCKYRTTVCNDKK